jgi:hypothetical protein
MPPLNASQPKSVFVVLLALHLASSPLHTVFLAVHVDILPLHVALHNGDASLQCASPGMSVTMARRYGVVLLLSYTAHFL